MSYTRTTYKNMPVMTPEPTGSGGLLVQDISKAAADYAWRQIRVIHDDGTMDLFIPAADADADRGTALLAAAAAAVTGDEVVVGPGTFLCDDELPIKSQVTYLGVPGRTLISFTAGVGTAYGSACTFDAVSGGVTLDGLGFDDSNRSLIMFLWFNATVSDWTITNCTFNNGGIVLTMGGTTTVTRLRFSGNRINAHSGLTVTLSAASHSIFTKNIVDDAGGFTISGTGNTIAKNRIALAGATRASLGSGIKGVMTGSRVTGNVLSGGQLLAGGGSSAGVYLTAGSEGCTVLGNDCSAGWYGIWLLGSGHTVSGNTCHDNWDDGIRVGCTDSTITGNDVFENLFNGIMLEGADGDTADNVVTGNNCHDNGKGKLPEPRGAITNAAVEAGEPWPTEAQNVAFYQRLMGEIKCGAPTQEYAERNLIAQNTCRTPDRAQNYHRADYGILLALPDDATTQTNVQGNEVIHNDLVNSGGIAEIVDNGTDNTLIGNRRTPAKFDHGATSLPLVGGDHADRRLLYSADMELCDSTSLASESLSDPADFSTGNWILTGEFAAAGTYATYTYAATGSGGVRQAIGNMAIIGKRARWYKLTYTISDDPTVEDAAMVLTTAFSEEQVPLPINEGPHTVFFKSAASPGDFFCSVSGATAGAFTIEDVSLKQVGSAEIRLHGSIIADLIGGMQQGADPAQPAEGEMVIWLSDGTGKGDAGDVLIASKTSGTTKWATLFDHSGGAAW